MSEIVEAPGLTADWLNGWLAAIGVAVLLPDVCLSWADEAVPFALFKTSSGYDLPGAIARAMEDEESLQSSVLARSLEGRLDFTRSVTLDAYRERAALERSTHSDHLAASVSDLRQDFNPEKLDHGALDPSAPRGETLWTRAVACATSIPSEKRTDWVRKTLVGLGIRVQVNGLGFDPRRFSAGVQATGKASKVYADPVVELLCFSALALFPTRGNGRRIRQRGWIDRATQAGSFEWAAWRPFLDRWGIDAFLDVEDNRRYVLARYRVVPYQAAADADPTRAYFAERVGDR